MSYNWNIYGSFKTDYDLYILGHGGGWGYSAHSVEAIRFSADTDILLGGLGLFGGRGEYTAKIKVKFINSVALFCLKIMICT